MEKKIIGRMREIVRNENENVKREFEEDRKDLKNYNGDFVWAFSERGTNLIINAPFCYVQVENMKEDLNGCYACTGGKLRKITPERAKKLTIGMYNRFQHA